MRSGLVCDRAVWVEGGHGYVNESCGDIFFMALCWLVRERIVVVQLKPSFPPHACATLSVLNRPTRRYADTLRSKPKFWPIPSSPCTSCREW